MSQRLPTGPTQSGEVSAVRLPDELLMPASGGPLRDQLIGLVEMIEHRAGAVQVSLWLEGTTDGRFEVRAAEKATARPFCSTAIRGEAGRLLGALTISASARHRLKPDDQTLIESTAWLCGRLLESAEAIEYRTLLDRVPSVIYIADTGENGRWHYVSAQVATILGFTPQEWCADPTLWARQLHPDDREWVLGLEPDERFDAWGDPLPHEYRLFDRAGSVVWVRDDAFLVQDELGRGRWHGVILDITDRKLAEAELERRAAQQAAVARLGEHALERVPIADLMQEAVATVLEVLAVDGALVAEVMPDGESFEFRASSGWPELEIGSASTADRTRSQAAYTVMTGEPVFVLDWETEDRFGQSRILSPEGIRSSLTVVIEGHDARFGVLGLHSRTVREFSVGDVDFVQSLANVLADALERQSTEDAMQHRALHDPLTGLPNRVLFLDRLEHALERLRRQPRSLAAVLFIDLDNFKLVNDSMGHHAGDELLAAVAARLKQAVRPSDTVARFGGDEFGLLLEELSSEREAIGMAERIASVFARPFALETNEHFVTTSVGIALAEGGELAVDLIRDADAAMYRAKERGRARYELYDEVMRGRAIARLRIENDLRRAIERNELRLAYQPVVSLRDESVVGVEALIRWDHPERGSIPPDAFIPIAEDSGLIERIGRWALEGACRQGAQWAASRPDAAPIGISVNLSPVQLSYRGCPEMVAEVLHSSGLDPTRLSLEITEQLLLGESEAIGDILRSLKALGVRLVLDDFGMGYSSLNYLTRLPLDALKVDRTFVHALGPDHAEHAITEAIIAMAKALSLEVVGEGTETMAQVDELRRLGCDFAQGYVFSPPLSARQMTNVIDRGMKLSRSSVQ